MTGRFASEIRRVASATASANTSRSLVSLVPVGVWVHAFRSTRVGRGAVCVGGSPARACGDRDLACLELVDDDRWHEAEFDARRIRDVFPDVKLLQTFRFYTGGNGKQGQQFWFDDFQILPEGRGK